MASQVQWPNNNVAISVDTEELLGSMGADAFKLYVVTNKVRCHL